MAVQNSSSCGKLLRTTTQSMPNHSGDCLSRLRSRATPSSSVSALSARSKEPRRPLIRSCTCAVAPSRLTMTSSKTFASSVAIQGSMIQPLV